MQRRPTGGKGSNQYQTRGQSGLVACRQDVADMRSAVENERVAASFGAAEPDTGIETEADMIRVAATGSPEKRADIARRDNCPESLLIVLADDRFPGVRHAALRNPRLPVEVLTAAVDAGAELSSVAANPACPPELLTRIADLAADDGNESASQAVSEHPATEPATLDRLAWDGYIDAVHHPNCPVDTLVAMAALRAGADIPDRNESVFDDRDDRNAWIGLKTAAAGHPNLPPTRIAALAKGRHRGRQAPWAAAALTNPSLPVPTATKA